MSYAEVMSAIESGLQAEYPARVVTRERRKWMQYTDAEAQSGLMVVSSKGAIFNSDYRIGTHQIQIVLVRRVMPTVGDVVSDADIQDAEFELVQELADWIEKHNASSQDCADGGFLLELKEFTTPPAEAKRAGGTAVVFCELERAISG
jgi:hypothetical protein